MKACLGLLNFIFQINCYGTLRVHQYCQIDALNCEKHREICVSYTYHIVSFELNESAFIILCTLFFMCDQAYVICISRTCIISCWNFLSCILHLGNDQGIRNPPWPNEHLSLIYIISLPFCAYMFSLSFLRTINVYP